MTPRFTVTALLLALSIAACDTTADRSNENSGTFDAPQSIQEHDVSCDELDVFIERTRRGYVPGRSPDLSLIVHEPNYVGTPAAAVHTGPFDFLAEVPLVFFGPGHVAERGRVQDSATMADVAPTIARLIEFDDFDSPSGHALDVSTASEKPPRLVVTVVWDGGGWNTLEQHPKAWPFLESIIRRGVSFESMTVGSTPTVTPPIHTTLGTGAFPSRHGIPHVKMTTESGDYVDPFEGNSARSAKLPSLADLYDRARDNAPLVGVVATVNWHLGMIGSGALIDGGDHDLAALLDSSGVVYGNAEDYELPADLSDPVLLDDSATAVDALDGTRDGEWRGHALDDLEVRYSSPAWVRFQETTLERAISTRGFGADEVPDLMFSNFKSIDGVGHVWGMESPEEGEVVRATDDALRALVKHLNLTVGREQWVLIVTADHGTARVAPDIGAWAIRGRDLQADLDQEFDVEGPPVVERVNSAGIYLDERQRPRVDVRAMSRWLLGYTAADNLLDIDEVPRYYADKAHEPLIDAVLDGPRVATRSCRG